MSLSTRIFAFLRHRLHLPEKHDVSRLHDDLRETAAAAERRATSAEQQAAGIAERLEAIEKRVGSSARKLDRLEKLGGDDRLILHRVDRAVHNPASPVAESEIVDLRPAAWPVIDEDWWLLEACPVCGGRQTDVVSEYNRFLLNDRKPEPGFEVYNYTLCRACGVVYAARRPRGRRYRALLEHFTENLGRAGGSGNPVLNPQPLTDETRAEIDRRTASGPMVSEHLDLHRRDWLPGLQADRLAAAQHVEILGSLLPLARARVLEIRSRTGAMLASLRRLFNAEVFAMSIFESQRYIAERVYGIRAGALIDFEDFTIPHDGAFDLVIANHMLTHAVAPRRFLEVVASRLQPGGHFYLYNEPDDAEFLSLHQSMFRVLNPFHLQTFDRPALERLLRACGFDPVFVGHHGHNFLCLARRDAGAAMTPMPDQAADKRRAAYSRARDVAILSAPPGVQALFGAELAEVTERAVLSGLADLDERGRLILRHKAEARESDRVEAAYH